MILITLMLEKKKANKNNTAALYKNKIVKQHFIRLRILLFSFIAFLKVTFQDYNQYGKNILTVPWIELGGKTSIICSKTGYVANIEFRTKPFYGGKKDSLRAEVFGPNDKKPFLTVEGEWNDKMWAKWSHGRNELFIDTRSLPTVKKHVLPRSRQAENESRRYVFLKLFC
ncbi:unnamed protein product [Trichobilharzia regenti]|nr:unnamed protein product [Trichobilharzia regenti]